MHSTLRKNAKFAYPAEYEIVFVRSLSRARVSMSKVQIQCKFRMYHVKCLNFDTKAQTQRFDGTTLREWTIFCLNRQETCIFAPGGRAKNARQRCWRVLPGEKFRRMFSLQPILGCKLNITVFLGTHSYGKTKYPRTTNTTPSLSADNMAEVFLLGPRLPFFALAT